MLRRDPEATAKAGFTDPRSYVAFRLPGEKIQHRYLFGQDVTDVRWKIFGLAHGRCLYCKAPTSWLTGELHHIEGGRGRQRCWCEGNLAWACGPCHRKQHVRVGGRK